jgi:hypothetical protein
MGHFKGKGSHACLNRVERRAIVSDPRIRTLGLVASLFVLVISLCALKAPPVRAGGSGGVTPTPTTTYSTQDKTTIYYTVKRGDTLYRIAQQYGVTVQDLQTWNNISDPTKLSVGKRLKISPVQDAPITSSKTESSSTSQVVPFSTIIVFAVGFILVVGLFSFADWRKR